MIERYVFSPEAEDFIIKLRDTHSSVEITEMYNIEFKTMLTVVQVKNFIGRRKIYMSEYINFSAFPKGHVPFNKGRPWDEWLSEEKQERISSLTSVNLEKHRQKLLESTGGYHKDKDGYLQKNIRGTNKKIYKHREVWEAVNGKVPDGYMLVFRNGNREDCRLENLKLVKRAQTIQINKKGIKVNKENIDTVYNYVELVSLIEKRKRGRKNAGQNEKHIDGLK